MYKRILVPVDGSETAERGLNEAVGLARELHASVQLLHVVSDVQWLVDPMMLGDLPALRLELHRFGEELLANAAKVCEAAGIVPQTRLREAAGHSAGHVIVDEVTRSACDLVVMGTHGRRGVSRLVTGSDASVVVATSPVPVMLVNSRLIT